jgi:peroxiredoxin
MIQVGKKVENFTASAYYNDDIVTVNLEDYQGKWTVLMFYPADFTFICPTELEDAAKRYGEFKELGAEVLSVSTDTAFVHKAWHDTSPAIGKITYPMVADPTGAICKQFGTYLDDEGLSLRATAIIDPDGVLKSFDIHDNSIGRSTGEILRKLAAAKFVRENSGQVCPVSWEPGGETLTPGLDLVGKI